MPPPFRIGSKASWLVERRYTLDDETLKLDKEHAQEMLEAVPEDSIVDKQRKWMVLNTKYNSQTGKKDYEFLSINFVEIALTYLFLEPVMTTWASPV